MSVAVQSPQAISSRDADWLARILAYSRKIEGFSRADLIEYFDFSRRSVNIRLQELQKAKVILEGSLGESTGGRSPRTLHFNSEAGYVLAVEMGATSLFVVISDLSGNIIGQIEERVDVADGPEKVLNQIAGYFDKLVKKYPKPIWGIGIGLPGPVEFAMGRLVSPPIMPGWDRYPVRDFFINRYNVPVWVDNEVNLMALGESRLGLGGDDQCMVYIKIGTGIGGGLISGGRLHRGAAGAAGDLGHMVALPDSSVLCRCGKKGCLEAVASGAALARAGQQLASEKISPYLTNIYELHGEITAKTVGEAAAAGDPHAKKLIQNCGELIGVSISTILNFYNPSSIVIGGGVAGLGDQLLSSIRQTVYKTGTPLATRNLSINVSSMADQAGVKGAVLMVVDELFKPERLRIWIGAGSPMGKATISSIESANI